MLSADDWSQRQILFPNLGNANRVVEGTSGDLKIALYVTKKDDSVFYGAAGGAGGVGTTMPGPSGISSTAVTRVT